MMDSHVFNQKRKQYRVMTRQYLRLLKKTERAIGKGFPYMASYFTTLAEALRVELDNLQVELDIEKFTDDMK